MNATLAPIVRVGSLLPQIARVFRNVLPYLGLIAVVLMSSVTQTYPGRSPTQRNWPLGKLDRNNTFAQTFTAEQDELIAIRVLLFPGPSTRDDPITLRLHMADNPVLDLATATISTRALARTGATTFAFTPTRLPFPANSVTTTLRFQIEAPTLPPEDGIVVIAGPDTLSGGALELNGKPHRADLAFQPIYRYRPFDRIFPISRIAHSKPGLLGWPPLYAALAYLYSYTLVRVLFQLLGIIRKSIDGR